LVLADEPTGALDSQNSRILMEQFRHINKEFGSTILMVTHDAVMGSYADRVLFLRDGKIFSELKRGDKERKEFYQEILSLTASSGGEEGGEENVI
jgi:putative ABC transport system ATP-binding protein